MPSAHRPLPSDPPHLRAAFRDLGLSEIQGPRHEKRVVAMFAKAGFKQVKDDETFWCAAAVGCWLAEGGDEPSGSLMARSYSKYGKKLNKSAPAPRGAIAVWPRGAPPSGHVNLVLHDDGTYLTCIGGNQSNGKGGGVTITRERKSKLVSLTIPPSMEPRALVAEPEPETPVQEDYEVEVSAQRKAPWWKRLWLRWAGTGLGTYLGLGAWSDWQIAAVMLAGGVATAFACVGVFMVFMGRDGRAHVRAWAVRQFRD